tara:strand:+ start:335 stop:595 length:261 start_codon:yes stop_codon:yes gene_type:complete
MPGSDKLLSIQDLADEYGASAETFRAWIRNGELKAVNMSRSTKSKRPRFMVRESDLEEFFEKRTTADVDRPARRAKFRRKPYERIV